MDSTGRQNTDEQERLLVTDAAAAHRSSRAWAFSAAALCAALAAIGLVSQVSPPLDVAGKSRQGFLDGVISDVAVAAPYTPSIGDEVSAEIQGQWFAGKVEGKDGGKYEVVIDALHGTDFFLNGNQLQPIDRKCSKSSQDCSTTRCCKDPSMKCFEKDEKWASCMKECETGTHPGDPVKFRTPWACKVLTKASGAIETPQGNQEEKSQSEAAGNEANDEDKAAGDEGENETAAIEVGGEDENEEKSQKDEKEEIEKKEESMQKDENEERYGKEEEKEEEEEEEDVEAEEEKAQKAEKEEKVDQDEKQTKETEATKETEEESPSTQVPSVPESPAMPEAPTVLEIPSMPPLPGVVATAPPVPQVSAIPPPPVPPTMPPMLEPLTMPPPPPLPAPVTPEPPTMPPVPEALTLPPLPLPVAPVAPEVAMTAR